MLYKKTILSMASLALILTAGVASTYAFQGNINTKDTNYYTPERHEAMTEAFVNSDYAAWKETVGDRPIADKVSEEDFAKFAEAWRLAQDGQIEEARAIRQELGLGNGRMHGAGNGQLGSMEMHRGARMSGQFVDQNGNGICDNLDQ